MKDIRNEDMLEKAFNAVTKQLEADDVPCTLTDETLEKVQETTEKHLDTLTPIEIRDLAAVALTILIRDGIEGAFSTRLASMFGNTEGN